MEMQGEMNSTKLRLHLVGESQELVFHFWEHFPWILLPNTVFRNELKTPTTFKKRKIETGQGEGSGRGLPHQLDFLTEKYYRGPYNNIKPYGQLHFQILNW